MRTLLLSVAGSMIALITLAWLAVLLSRTIIKLLFGSFMKTLLTDLYSQNLWEFLTASRRVGLQTIVESNLRAERGEVVDRPFGSPNTFPALRGLLFNPAQLAKLPTPQGVPVDMSTVLGKRAQRPLRVGLPVVISGMAYGEALNAKVKVALAKGASMADTATNSGEGGFLPEEREAAKYYILQYNRGSSPPEPHILKQADMIEIQFGQGALAGTGHKVKAGDLGPRSRQMLGLAPGQDAVVHARQPAVDRPEDLKNLIDWIRSQTYGIPVSVKLAATNSLEEDLAIATWAGADAVAVDGAEAATKGSPPILQDDFGLPTVYAIIRAARFLETYGLKDRVDLIVSGGLFTPGDYLKALALGADAVAIGTMALFAMTHTQLLKALPWEPPTELVYFTGKLKKAFDVDRGATSLANYLNAVRKEMEIAIRALGKTAVSQVAREDLFALDPALAEAAGVELGRPGGAGNHMQAGESHMASLPAPVAQFLAQQRLAGIRNSTRDIIEAGDRALISLGAVEGSIGSTRRRKPPRDVE